MWMTPTSSLVGKKHNAQHAHNMLPNGSITSVIVPLNDSIVKGETKMYFKRIYDLRIDHDLTQQNIADFLGCKREVYRRYEKGERTIPVDFVIRLADLYGVSTDYLLEHTVKPAGRIRKNPARNKSERP